MTAGCEVSHSSLATASRAFMFRSLASDAAKRTSTPVSGYRHQIPPRADRSSTNFAEFDSLYAAVSLFLRPVACLFRASLHEDLDRF